MDFVNAWHEAEQIVYSHLLEATGSTDKKNAFLGFLPSMVNIWTLNTGGSSSNEQTLWAPDIVTIAFPAEIFGQFADRREAQGFAMRIIKALPLENERNVHVFRIAVGGAPQVGPDVIPAGNEGSKKFLVHTVTIHCDFVFSTGGRLA